MSVEVHVVVCDIGTRQVLRAPTVITRARVLNGCYTYSWSRCAVVTYNIQHHVHAHVHTTCVVWHLTWMFVTIMSSADLGGLPNQPVLSESVIQGGIRMSSRTPEATPAGALSGPSFASSQYRCRSVPVCPSFFMPSSILFFTCTVSV